MTERYDQPNRAARTFNAAVRHLAELGIGIAGSRALRVRGRTTGRWRLVVVNVLTVDGHDYVVSPRGNTQWVRNARAAGGVQTGPRWRRRDVRIREIADADKGHAGGLTPSSTESEVKRIAASIPVFELAG